MKDLRLLETDRSDGFRSYESEKEVFLMRVKEKYASRVVSSVRRSLVRRSFFESMNLGDLNFFQMILESVMKIEREIYLAEIELRLYPAARLIYLPREKSLRPAVRNLCQERPS